MDPSRVEMACDVPALLDVERRYCKDVVEMWMHYAKTASRYALGDEDVYVAVAVIDLLHQLVYETVAVSFVAELLGRSELGWRSERVDFMGTPFGVEAELTRKEFLQRAEAHLLPLSAPNGRPLRLMLMAERAFELASQCGCVRCYRCPHCNSNVCVCLRGLSDEELYPRCRAGGALQQSVFELWRRERAAWPTPDFDMMLLMGAVSLSEGINQNAGSEYLVSHTYKVRMHTEMKGFWLAAPTLLAKMPALGGHAIMHTWSTGMRHVMCVCPDCPEGRRCGRAEMGIAHPFFRGRCSQCEHQTRPCRDRCGMCCNLLSRCDACEKKRLKKPSGCPSNGEMAGMTGEGCSDKRCRCPEHVECACLKCVLVRTTAGLLRPARGLRVIAMDQLDPPSDVASVEHNTETETAPAIRQLASTVRWMVKEAKRHQHLCRKHSEWKPWNLASAEKTECARCLVVKLRKESWMVLRGVKNAAMHTAAASLCPVCVREVYGISAVHKHNKSQCPDCTDTVAALVRWVVGDRVMADIEADPAARCEAQATEASALGPTVCERKETDERCRDEYLHFSYQSCALAPEGIRKVPVTCQEQHGLAQYQRSHTQLGCQPSADGGVVEGAYDLRMPGLDLATGRVMRSEASYCYKMEKGSEVITMGMHKLEGLGVACMQAAQNATRVSVTAATPRRLLHAVIPHVLKRKFASARKELAGR